MATNHEPHFQIGQQIESRTFEDGYRGAWFRSKIRDTSLRKGQTWHQLEFFDYPGEGLHWSKLYQKTPWLCSGEKKTMLMMRPSFPQFYHESEKFDLDDISDVIAIINDVWKVGDMVDWWSDHCYWSGRVTQLLGKDKVEVKLSNPPLGEGKTYEAFCKDLRPSLDWSPEYGWTVPVDEEIVVLILVSLVLGNRLRGTLGFLIEENQLAFIQGLKEFSGELPKVDSEKVGDPISTTRGAPRMVQYSSRMYQNELRVSGSGQLFSKKPSDSVESSIMDLEELASKIHWVRAMLQCEFQLSTIVKSSWKLVENHG
ncbi:hypothetical protein QJS10_CPB22g00285 [Acorus calamus]|uniref:Agenet domain-containing protein n=1 Tax=Acorus calamus TaxID=4465 RepID=A0AAV9C0B7_ACOCL|nr:hypothetical protein QJS10_CPB22g00285 [Acorus calamus]